MKRREKSEKAFELGKSSVTDLKANVGGDSFDQAKHAA
jgi:hypothetical protein